MNAFGGLRQAGLDLTAGRKAGDRFKPDIGKMNVSVSLTFALFGIVALVAPSFALYMLTVPAPPAA